MNDVLSNIFLGIISGILATFITNVFTQYIAEKRCIERIQRSINEYIYVLEKYKKERQKTSIIEDTTDLYIEVNNLFDSVYADISEQATFLHFLKRKSDEIMTEFSYIRRKINSEKKFNIDWCIEHLDDLREHL